MFKIKQRNINRSLDWLLPRFTGVCIEFLVSLCTTTHNSVIYANRRTEIALIGYPRIINLISAMWRNRTLKYCIDVNHILKHHNCALMMEFTISLRAIYANIINIYESIKYVQ